MEQKNGIGYQSYEEMMRKNIFYIDKTLFIRDWWENADKVTLITRPRRFGKTLNMSTVECFFSNKYAGRGDLFEGKAIWKEEKYRQLQGAYPVVSISFADVKATEDIHMTETEENFMGKSQSSSLTSMILQCRRPGCRAIGRKR